MGQGLWDISAVAFGSQRRRSVLCNLIIAQIMFALSFLPATAVVVAVVSTLFFILFVFYFFTSDLLFGFSCGEKSGVVGFGGDCDYGLFSWDGDRCTFR